MENGGEKIPVEERGVDDVITGGRALIGEAFNTVFGDVKDQIAIHEAIIAANDLQKAELDKDTKARRERIQKFVDFQTGLVAPKETVENQSPSKTGYRPRPNGITAVAPAAPGGVLQHLRTVEGFSQTPLKNN